MGQGYISVWRSIFDNPLWLEEKFTRGQAWIDLLLLANHEKGYIRKRGIRIEINRGEVGRSKETLADRWQWSRNKLTGFLSELEDSEMIEIVNRNSKVLQKIRIINYDKYQAIEQQNLMITTQRNEDFSSKSNNRMNNKKTSERQQKDTNNNDNNVNKLKKDTNVSKKESGFKKPSLDEVKEFFKEKETWIDPEEFFNHYEAVNWFRGKTKIKNWKLCLVTWEKMNPKKGVDRINKKQENKKTDFCQFCRTGNGFITYEGEKHQCPHGDSSGEILEKLGLI